MAETQQTMTEFTFAPGEKNIIGDRFSPSVIIFWLKTSIAASSTRIQYTTPNTLFGLIPLGVDTKTIPLRNVASVDTSTKFNLGSLVWGVVFLLIGLGCLDSSVAVALVLILVAAANLANTMSAQLDFVNQAGGRNSVKVSILEKDKLMQLAQNIQRLVFADVEGQRHQESMDMAQKQYTAQTNSVPSSSRCSTSSARPRPTIIHRCRPSDETGAQPRPRPGKRRVRPVENLDYTKSIITVRAGGFGFLISRRGHGKRGLERGQGVDARDARTHRHDPARRGRACEPHRGHGQEIRVGEIPDPTIGEDEEDA